MIPLHTRTKSRRHVVESDWLTCTQHFIHRHARSRTSITTAIVVFILITLLLWPNGTSTDLESLYTPYDSQKPLHGNLPLEQRAEAVKDAFLHAYTAYERYAMPADEFRPVSNGSQQNFNGWGVSMYDGLDTLWIMGLDSQFERAVRHISVATFKQRPDERAMFFETVIRYLGGLLSAYALSGRTVLLDKANELGEKLLPAFNTTTGMPVFGVNTVTGKLDLGPRKGDVIIAEIASCQMEYKYLAYLTGKTEYFLMADKTMSWLKEGQPENGMWNTLWNGTTGEQIDDRLTIGAWADSAYEYLLKQYLLSGRTETTLRDMYIKSTSGVIRNLLYLSPTRNILYVTATNGGVPSRAFEHLACFYPGLLALGASELAGEMDEQERRLHLWAAEGLAHSCWLMYADRASGLAPEEVVFERWAGGTLPPGGPADDARDGLWIDAVDAWMRAGMPGGKPPGVGELANPVAGTPVDYWVKDSKYLLRPETIESLYIMWRTTGDEVWREHGWQIFMAIETLCRTRSGYASVKGVDRGVRELVWIDEMPSYALAETWKYLYLMFLDHDPLPTDQYVFNTEAHPFRIFHWDEREKETYGIHGL